MNIQEITNYHEGLKDPINKFLTQLVEGKCIITNQQIEAIILDTNSHLFFAINEDGGYMGMLTVGTYTSPTGKKAWIEDVVVDNSHRGQGVGETLVEFAIQFAKDKKAGVIMLTSSPARISANNLYKKIGFQQKETNVYRIVLK